MERKYYYGIDALRFFSAVIVAFFHLGYSTFKEGSRGYELGQGLVQASYREYLFWGHIGVPIFFVISGLVIANSANGSNASRFFQSRVERLYPAVWVCATISLLAWTIGGVTSFKHDVIAYINSMVLFPLGQKIDAPYWTLPHEIIFYAAVAVLLMLRQGHRLEAFAIAVTCWSGVFWAMALLHEFAGVSVPGLRLLSDGAGAILLTGFGGFFALGIFIWLRLNVGLSRIGWVAAALALAECCAKLITDDRYDPIEIYIWLGAMIPLAAAAAHGGPIKTERRDLILLRKLGLATYPLYLIHFSSGILLLKVVQSAGIHPDLALPLVVTFFTLVAIGIATYIEPAIRRVLRPLFAYAYSQCLRRLPLLAMLNQPNRPITVSSA